MFKRIVKITLLLLFLFVSPNLYTHSDSIHDETVKPSSLSLQNHLTIDNFTWTGCIANRSVTHLEPGILDDGFIFELSSNSIHVLENITTYDRYVGVYTEVPVSNDTLNLSFYGRARADFIEAVRLRVAIYDPCTLEELFYWSALGNLETLDSSLRFFEKTFLIQDYDSVLLYFYYGDGWVMDWNQEFWIVDLRINTDVDTSILYTNYIESFFASSISNPLSLTWYKGTILSACQRGRSICQFNPQTGCLLDIWTVPSGNPIGIAFDGENFWAIGVGSTFLYKLDSNLNLLDSVVLDIQCRGGIAFDGNSIWISNKDTQRIYKINQNNGKTVNSLYNEEVTPMILLLIRKIFGFVIEVRDPFTDWIIFQV